MRTGRERPRKDPNRYLRPELPCFQTLLRAVNDLRLSALSDFGASENFSEKAACRNRSDRGEKAEGLPDTCAHAVKMRGVRPLQRPLPLAVRPSRGSTH